MTRYGAKIENGVVTQVHVLAHGAEGDKTAKSLKLVEEDGVLPGIGWSWNGSSFEPAVVPMTWEDIRLERDRRLAASDWTQVADAPVDAAAWATYRQQLRDLPQNYILPSDVEWPQEP